LPQGIDLTELADLVVIGGGASGLIAAYAGAKLGLNVRLLEKTDLFGRKLAVTGGGKCNFTHEDPPRPMADRFEANPRLLVPLLKRFPFQRVVGLFREVGVHAKTDNDGCVWPARMNGSRFRNLLARAAQDAGAELLEGQRVSGLASVDGVWEVVSNGDAVRGRNVLLATGGASYPQTGSSGDGLAMCRELGLECRDWFPALCSLRPERPVGHLSGNTRHNVLMRLEVDGGEKREATGHFLFTHEYVSGSSVLNLSGHAARGLAEGRKVELVVDWVPEKSEEELRTELGVPGRRRVANVLAPLVSRRFALDLVERCGIPAERTVSELSRAEREAAIRELKATRFRITGTEPLERATVCGGGLGLEEVDLATCRVRKLDGLYAAGELLDTWAETGGYNLHFCWATGIAAAEAIAGKKLG